MAVVGMGLILSSCAGMGKPKARNGMVPYKSGRLDLSYPESWTIEKVTGNPVVMAKLYPGGDVGFPIFCFKGTGLEDKMEIVDTLMSGMREVAPNMTLVSHKQLEDGSEYQIHEGHVTTNGVEETMKAFIGLKLEGNDCGYALFAPRKVPLFESTLEGSIAVLKSFK
ncbi:MAG: hypothetical protein GWM98_02565 [Nitrospinaceae bacterium]|nr:hypothetical protein [Nitrospinaceae bacterium]NIR53586.1 hypothetical protein [Nitrospinaceae bacterium]NIS83987.1 hypothetical protein [Nitrospinaceae bacterium]NIT80796.1 hypothetical protein [Nitrospinaceae bacterium]NIU43102.1 hypothetical protein [Nitrospinaceae bacterium]